MSKIKKGQTFSISRFMNVSASKLWQVIGEKYGEIEKYHPDIFYSNYVKGFSSGGEGSERVVYLNESKTKIAYEKQLDYNPQNYSFISQSTKFVGAAMTPEATFMKYKIEPINEDSCKLIGEMSFRTNPAFIGWFFKSILKNTSHDHFIAIEHYTTTGVPINKQNRSSIIGKYR